MAETWRVRTLGTGTKANRRLGTEGLFGIINNTAAHAIRIRSISILIPSGVAGYDTPTTPQTGLGRYRLFGITGVSAGFAEALAYTKLDSNDPDLPAEVLIRNRPDTVTEDREFRFQGDLPGISPNSPAHYVNKPIGKDALMFDCPDVTGATPIVLREGQGIAIIEAGQQSVPHLQMGEITLRNAATGAIYQIFNTNMNTREAGAFPAMAIMNGVGSGIVLEVIKVYLPNVGGNQFLVTQTPKLKLYPINYFSDRDGGEALTANPHDSSNAALPSGVDIRKNFEAFPQLWNKEGNPDRATGAWDSLWSIHSVTIAIPGIPAAPAIMAAWAKTPAYRVVYKHPFGDIQPVAAETSVARNIFSAKAGDQGIVLRRKEGLGVISLPQEVVSGVAIRNALYDAQPSTYSNLDIACEFDLLSDPPPSSGGIAELVDGGLVHA